MSIDPSRDAHASALPRLFLHEPGWRIATKVGSDREFCYMVAPGQDSYHRLLDGEIFLSHGVEKLCLACADRRGLLAHGIKPLGEAVAPIEIPADAEAKALRLKHPGSPDPMWDPEVDG